MGIRMHTVKAVEEKAPLKKLMRTDGIRWIEIDARNTRLVIQYGIYTTRYRFIQLKLTQLKINAEVPLWNIVMFGE